jgi:hypothetical protein
MRFSYYSTAGFRELHFDATFPTAQSILVTLPATP